MEEKSQAVGKKVGKKVDSNKARTRAGKETRVARN